MPQAYALSLRSQHRNLTILLVAFIPTSHPPIPLVQQITPPNTNNHSKNQSTRRCQIRFTLPEPGLLRACAGDPITPGCGERCCARVTSKIQTW